MNYITSSEQETSIAGDRVVTTFDTSLSRLSNQLLCQNGERREAFDNKERSLRWRR